MKLNLTVQQIIDAAGALQQLAKMSFRDAKLSYAIIRNIRVTRPIAEDFEKAKNVLMAQYPAEQEGNLIKIKFTGPEDRASFQMEYDKLFKTEEALDIWELSIVALLASDAGVTAEQILMLGPFAVDDVPESDTPLRLKPGE